MKARINALNIFVILAMALLTSGLSLAAEENPRVKLETEMGDIMIELYPSKAPVSVDNFIKNVNNFHYDGLIFHRVIKGFMIQTGGFTFDFSPRDAGRPAIINESSNGLTNRRGSVAMARMNDPDSAKAQFFINHKTNRFLDPKGDNKGYAVFGDVISGMDVVDAIASLETQTLGMYADVPFKTTRILSARLVNPKAWTPLAEPEPEVAAYEKPIPVR
jgi:cyclophilin family peptidyl-prolyl cis-trans isomerase